MAGFIHYHNTITIPNDENWILQGRVDPVSGLPSSLDGRLKSGTAVDRSHASIVLRHLRISGQVAPVDVNPIPRSIYLANLGNFGGAFEYGPVSPLDLWPSLTVVVLRTNRYDGGSADQNLVKIIFIEVVFDHNAAAG